MLHLRREQLAVLTRAMHARFDYTAYQHVCRYFPEQREALGKKGTMHLVRDGLSQARTYGFVSQYDLLRFLNLVFTYGSGFEYKEEYAWTIPYLADESRAPNVRMDLLMYEACHRQYPDLYPLEDAPEFGPEPRPEESAEAEGQIEDEDVGGPDVLIWDATPTPDTYVPESVQPEILPYTPPPRPGTVPLEAVAPTEQDDELPTLSEEEWAEMELENG
ncbi:hypothetical protein F183_A44650 [Bryobacterales bacterium F-183]|nr:hypothetical protein F183_A44650 [Bryobacterales bacterium F-183]